MSFNLFGPATKCDIRVGYIDPERGFVGNLSVYDANKYAKLNPGTTFIFRRRDKIQFMNINEVNALEGKDLLPTNSASGSKGCDGVTGLDIYEDSPSGESGFSDLRPEVLKEIPPKVRFSGGGGIGAKGNPIIGNDGSLLAVDLIDGGWGYQYAPITEVFDEYGIGSGAVVRSIMIGDPGYPECKFLTTVETFEREEDFEEYDFSSCAPAAGSGSFGRRYNKDGKDIGIWDPTVYANLDNDPARIEIQRYQDFLLSLRKGQKINIDQNIIRNWWTTRQERPIQVTARNKKTRVVHKVDYPAWSDFMNLHAISPVPPSNAPGSDFAGIEHTMEWEEDFPHDGEYTFKYLADNVADFYLDNELIGRVKRFKGSPDKLKKFVKSGVHRIRIDLENIPIYEKVIIQPPLPTPEISAKREYNIEYSNRASSTTGKRVVNNNRKIEFDDDATNGFDLNASFTIVSTSPGLKAKFSNNGSKLIVTGQSKGNVTLRLKWDDNPRISGIAVGEIKINGTQWTQSGKKGSTQKKIKVDAIKVPATQSSEQRTPSKSQGSTQGSVLEEVFNTKEFIDKADRKLWRINPNAGRDGDFLSKFGVLPINPDTNKAQTDDFAGNYVIRWEYVDFPISGNYSIETMVDDDVTLYIGNRAGGGRMAIGNGLGDINNGGDEVIIRKKGFSSPGRSTGKSIDTRYFDAGKYRIRAELKQIRGKPLSGGNPMALAVRIRATFKEKKVVSARSWNQNPMGAALVIEAPLPPIPQEPKPVAEGRCPNNPIWTTRFPGSRDRWFPVTLDERWSPFMNRYALSPIPPLSTPGSDNAGGQPYRTSWVIEAPYAGFYGLKGTVDNGGKILVDGKEIMSGGLNYPRRGLEGFKSQFPQTVKFPLSEGKHTIEVEVVNQTTDTFEKVNKKVFDTRDWGTPAKTSEKEGNSPVTYIGLKRQKSNNDNKSPIQVAAPGTKNRGPRAQIVPGGVSNKEIQFTDADFQNDTDARFSIQSTSPGVSAKFSPDGKELIVKGKGDVTLRLGWSESPISNGQAVGELKVAGETFRQTKDRKSEQIKTIKVGSGSGSETGKLRVTNGGKKIEMRDGHGDDTNSSFTIVAGDATFSNNGRSIIGKGECTIELNWNDNPNVAGVAVEQIKIEGVTWTQSGKRGKDKKTVRIGTSKSTGLESGSVKNGVTYSGPPISSYIKGMISPTLQDVNARPNEEIQGKQWVMRWDNVDFPISGQYKIRTLVDDEVDVLIDGVKVQTATIKPKERRSEPANYQAFNATAGKKSIELRLRNIRIPNTGFQQNPTAVRMDIIVPVDVSTGLSRPWIDNPVGISAILIPPPCPKEVTGKGKICRIVVDDPGNGFPRPPTGGTGDGEYPVTLELDGIEVINPGINHNCGVDQVVIEPSNGAQLSYQCDTFGRITNVNIVGPPPRGFTTTPDIRVITETGTNFQAVPRFRVVRDPVGVDVEPEQILQVTDLVGLKLTGYVEGRAYYGSVFFKDGVRYAGIYETPGQLIQVYDTLQESIDAEVTTPPSAIQRSGTDVRSNNPRLNIPGTPDSLT